MCTVIMKTITWPTIPYSPSNLQNQISVRKQNRKTFKLIESSMVFKYKRFFNMFFPFIINNNNLQNKARQKKFIVMCLPELIFWQNSCSQVDET